jgi:hypothetical protein
MKSFFDTCESTLTQFGELPLPAKKAIIWRWVFEGESSLWDHMPHFAKDGFKSPSDITKVQWHFIFEILPNSFNKTPVYYSEVDTQVVIDTLLAHHCDIKDDWDTWSDYKAFYGTKDVPHHSDKDRFPCLSPLGDDEIFEDGWHRLHSYINSNHTTIPIVQY